MARRSLTHAWDDLWEAARPFLRQYEEEKRTPNEAHLVHCLHRLRGMRLPAQAVDMIAECIDTVRKICNESEVTR